MMISMGGIRIEITYAQRDKSSDGLERLHKQNALEKAIREARCAEEIRANAHLKGLR